MMNKVFLDTNILLYLYATDEIKKTDAVKKLLEQHQNITISTQVLFEFSNIMYKKYKCSCDEIKKILEEFHRSFNIAIINYETLFNTLKIISKYKYSLPDSLILATALEYECTILFSEDMHSDQIVDSSLKIINPFL